MIDPKREFESALQSTLCIGYVNANDLEWLDRILLDWGKSTTFDDPQEHKAFLAAHHMVKALWDFNRVQKEWRQAGGTVYLHSYGDLAVARGHLNARAWILDE